MKKMLSFLFVLILAQAATVAIGAQSRSGVVTLSVDLSAQASGQGARRKMH